MIWTVDIFQLVCSDILFTQTQRNFFMKISLHKNYNATWVRKASFGKGAVLLYTQVEQAADQVT